MKSNWTRGLRATCRFFALVRPLRNHTLPFESTPCTAIGRTASVLPACVPKRQTRAVSAIAFIFLIAPAPMRLARGSFSSGNFLITLRLRPPPSGSGMTAVPSTMSALKYFSFVLRSMRSRRSSGLRADPAEPPQVAGKRSQRRPLWRSTSLCLRRGAGKAPWYHSGISRHGRRQKAGHGVARNGQRRHPSRAQDELLASRFLAQGPEGVQRPLGEGPAANEYACFSVHSGKNRKGGGRLWLELCRRDEMALPIDAHGRRTEPRDFRGDRAVALIREGI